MPPNEGVEIWKAAAMTLMGFLQAIGLGMLFYIIKRLDAITKDGSRTKERVSRIEGHLEADDQNFRPYPVD